MFVRTLERADRVHLAMQGRGYRGEIHSLGPPRFVPADAAVLALVAGYLVLCRWGLPQDASLTP
jgi:energy-coupling factor transporter transmembrane protein EcfT